MPPLTRKTRKQRTSENHGACDTPARNPTRNEDEEEWSPPEKKRKPNGTMLKPSYIWTTVLHAYLLENSHATWEEFKQEVYEWSKKKCRLACINEEKSTAGLVHLQCYFEMIPGWKRYQHPQAQFRKEIGLNIPGFTYQVVKDPCSCMVYCCKEKTRISPTTYVPDESVFKSVMAKRKTRQMDWK